MLKSYIVLFPRVVVCVSSYGLHEDPSYLCYMLRISVHFHIKHNVLFVTLNYLFMWVVSDAESCLHLYIVLDMNTMKQTMVVVSFVKRYFAKQVCCLAYVYFLCLFCIQSSL